MSLLQDAGYAVLCDPWPDAPRLEFADAVAATDPNRAAFIRADLAVLRAAHAAKSPKASDVSAPDAAFTGHWRPWVGRLDSLVPGGSQNVGFGRGFVQWVTETAEWLLEHAPDLFARARPNST